jgi:hypothetical protein
MDSPRCPICKHFPVMAALHKQRSKNPSLLAGGIPFCFCTTKINCRVKLYAPACYPSSKKRLPAVKKFNLAQGCHIGLGQNDPP